MEKAREARRERETKEWGRPRIEERGGASLELKG
jgi:hypothetical protein